MNPQTVALAKVVKTKDLTSAREGLSVGSHAIDCWVRITGSIKVGEDTVIDVRGNPPNYKAAFASIFGLMTEQLARQGRDLTAEQKRELVEVALRQSENIAKLGNEIMPTVDAVEYDMTSVIGTAPRKGAVTTKLEYAFVDPKKVQQAA